MSVEQADERILRLAFDDAPPPPEVVEGDDEDGDGEPVPERTLLVWAILTLSWLLVKFVELAVWCAAFWLAHFWWPGAAWDIAEEASIVILSAIAAWGVNGYLCRRLGWWRP